MKAKIWVLCTVLADENAPAMPAVFGDEAEAWAKYDEMIRAEWDSMMDPDTDGPYPGDPDAAQDQIRQAHGAEWSRWELTCHDIEISATK
jgi:predicted phosphohydrolase